MRTPLLRGLAMVLCLALATPSPALACPFHGYLPPLTVVDRLLDADRIVVARPDPAGRLVARETLRGPDAPAALPPPDRTALDRLEASPADGLLYAHDPIDGRWRQLAYLDAAYRQAVEAVLAGAERWSHPEAAARFRLAAGWLDAPDPRLRELALRELDRAPYALLRSLDLDFDPTSTAGQGDPALAPIRALLLGASGGPAAAEAVRAGLTKHAYGPGWSTALGAYAVALVEIDGEAGLDRLEREFLAAPQAGPDQLGPVIEALAIHRGLDAEPAPARIDARLARLVDRRPETAVLVARRFGSREDWSQAAPLERLLQEKRIAAATSLIAVSSYVAMARQAAGPVD